MKLHQVGCRLAFALSALLTQHANATLEVSRSGIAEVDPYTSNGAFMHQSNVSTDGSVAIVSVLPAAYASTLADFGHLSGSTYTTGYLYQQGHFGTYAQGQDYIYDSVIINGEAGNVDGYFLVRLELSASGSISDWGSGAASFGLSLGDPVNPYQGAIGFEYGFSAASQYGDASWSSQCRVGYSGQGNCSFDPATGIFKIPFSFTAGHPLQLEANLYVQSAETHSAAGQADFAIVLPFGATLTTGSGYSYESLSAVPEPETFTMMLVGLAGIGSVGRRRN